MPVLKNQRWERLAQELAQNKTATEAMQAAGYSDPRNSTRLTKKEEIRRRIEELQIRGAERAEVSIASLLGELEAAREKASNLDQLSAAVRAIEAKAKVSGLMVQKVEIGGLTQEGPDDADIGGLGRWFAANYRERGIKLTDAQAVEFEDTLVQPQMSDNDAKSQTVSIGLRPAVRQSVKIAAPKPSSLSKAARLELMRQQLREREKERRP